MYKEELKAKKEKLISSLSEYVLTARGYINDSKVQKEVTLKKGKFHVKNATEGSKIQPLSEDEKLILAYEASRSEKKRYDSNMLKNILEIKRRIFLFGSKEDATENILKNIDEINKPTRIITKRTKKTFLQIKKEQIQMLKDKKTRADGVSLLLGVVNYGNDYIETQEEVEHILSKEEETNLKKLNLLLNLINGETKKFVEEQLVLEIENEKMNVGASIAGPQTIEEKTVEAKPEEITEEPKEIQEEIIEEISEAKTEPDNVGVDAHGEPQIIERENIETKSKEPTTKSRYPYDNEAPVSEEELQDAFNSIAEVSASAIINTESIDDLIKFIKQQGEIKTELNGKKYTLLYREAKDLKEKNNYKNKLANFYIKQPDGLIKQAHFSVTDTIILSNEINMSQVAKKHSDENEQINPEESVSKLLALMLESRYKWLEFNMNLKKTEMYFIDEIEKLKEAQKLVNNKPDEFFNLEELINQKELLLQILTGKKAQDIVDKALEGLKQCTMEDLKDIYMKTINESEKTTIVEKVPEINNYKKNKIYITDRTMDRLKIIAEAMTLNQIDSRNIKELIEFLQNSQQDIKIEIDGERYKLKYDEKGIPEKDKLSGYERELRGFIFEREDGKFMSSFLLLKEVVILNHSVQEAIKHQKNNRLLGNPIPPAIIAERVLTAIIEVKGKLIKNNFDKSLVKTELDKEIEALIESQKPLSSEQSRLEKQSNKENDKTKAQELKNEKINVHKKRNQIEKVISGKKLSIQIVSDQLINEIRQVQYEKMSPQILEDLIEKYNEACGQVETKEER